MGSNNDYVLLDKELLERCFKDLASSLRKGSRNGRLQCELIVVGGASIVLNYGFRLSTSDVDCTDEHKILMNDVINKIAEKHNLPASWINTNFMNSNSYSDRISQYSAFYKSYGNGTLTIRTIKDEYLLAMKVVSGRKYKNDYSDIYGILDYCNAHGKKISVDLLDKAIFDLYGSRDKVSADAYAFAVKMIEDPSSIQLDQIVQSEKENAETITANDKNNLSQADIEYILSKLELQ